MRILVLMLEKKYFHKENKNKKQTFLELKQLLENKTVNTSLKYVCKRTPFYRQIMLKLLAAGICHVHCKKPEKVKWKRGNECSCAFFIFIIKTTNKNKMNKK